MADAGLAKSFGEDQPARTQILAAILPCTPRRRRQVIEITPSSFICSSVDIGSFPRASRG